MWCARPWAVEGARAGRRARVDVDFNLASPLALADAGQAPLERLHGLANAADVLDAWAQKARDDARARASLAAGLRHGADPDALAAALRGFDGRGRGGPLVQRTLERLALTSERVESLFSR